MSENIKTFHEHVKEVLTVINERLEKIELVHIFAMDCEDSEDMYYNIKLIYKSEEHDYIGDSIVTTDLSVIQKHIKIIENMIKGLGLSVLIDLEPNTY